jgi:DNA mismatch endonuclease (patch repair protein)
VTDIVDKNTRSRMMAGIKGKDTKPELALRRALHVRGFRFRLHSKQIDGRPDIVLSKHNAVVFVHGCFWHQHAGCRYATTPSTRAEYWREKFQSNLIRDNAVQQRLLQRGWRVAIVWECALHGSRSDIATDMLTAWLVSGGMQLELGEANTQIL